MMIHFNIQDPGSSWKERLRDSAKMREASSDPSAKEILALNLLKF